VRNTAFARKQRWCAGQHSNGSGADDWSAPLLFVVNENPQFDWGFRKA